MKDKMNYRLTAIQTRKDGKPVTLNEEDRSVEIVAATEITSEVFDWRRFEVVNEILIMSGLEMPKTRQVPLLDSHSRSSASSVMGSVRDMSVQGDQLTGRAFFSTVPEAEGPYTKVREGHLTDFSIGYRVVEAEWVPAGKTATVQGRSFSGPVSVVTRWRVKEVSVVPIGADENAKARAEAENQHAKEKNKMNEELRKYLESRGLPKEATEAEAQAFADTMEPKRKEPEKETADIDKIRAEATGAERERITEIDAMCRKFECEKMAEDLIRSGSSMIEAKEKVFEVVQKRHAEKEKERKAFPPATIEADERDKFRSAAGDALLLRAGLKVDKPAPGASDIRGYSMIEMARMCLRFAKKDLNGNYMEMVGRALTTSDFPYLLANVANKALFTGWETAEETWNVWCGTDQVNDFKTHYRPRVSEATGLDEIPEHGEYKYGKRTEAQESFAIATYGKLYAITRQAIINDDLGAISNPAMAHGEAASRKIGDIAYAVLTANAAMGDGITLFHASHANVGTGGVVSETTIGEAIKLMKLQKDLQGLRRLNIRAEIFIAPVTLEGAAEIFFTSNQFTGSDATSFRTNPYAGTRFVRVYEPRLDDSSTTAWYCAARQGRTVVVFFLNGIQTPYLETKSGWSVDGVEYKVRIDVGAKAMDWKGLVKNAGA